MKILERHHRLWKIGESLLNDEAISEEDRQFLGNALINIGYGADARDQLQTKPKRGERSFATSWERELRNRYALGWIAAAKASVEDGGLGLTLDEAIKLLEKSANGRNPFSIDPDTVRKYWNNRPDRRNVEFTLGD